MQIRISLLTLCILFFVFNSYAQNKVRPKIGLSLSGGGAKGLAHIGILEAIDSAGLQVDYITGTSMGSIIGAMYAIGYSGNQIEQLVRKLNWDELLSAKPPLSLINIEEKEEYNSYSFEIPISHWKPKLGTGAINAQEVWIKFSEIFMPVYNIKDFSKFNIPFKCVATDVSTGKAVLIDSGEIVMAIRASMAIPSVFTSMNYNNKMLIDGGIVHNFPVTDVKAMGADYIIGSNVWQGLQKAEELENLLDILYQISTFKDADDLSNQISLCNTYIQPNIKGFSAASFSSSDTIINIGKQEGKKIYPYFKHLADSLNLLYPETRTKKSLPNIETVVIDEITVEGLKNTTENLFYGQLNLGANESYTPKEIADAIRDITGNQYYSQIIYTLSPTIPGHAIMNCKVNEKPLTYLKHAIHYNTFTDIAMIFSLNKRNFILDQSDAYIKLNISQNFRGKTVYRKYLNYSNTYALTFSTYYEKIQTPVYSNYHQSQLFTNYYGTTTLDFHHFFNRSCDIALGFGYEDNRLEPKYSTLITYTVKNSNFNIHTYIKYNTLNRKDFSQSGSNLNFNLSYIFNQLPDNNYFTLSERYFNLSNSSLLTQNYSQLAFKFKQYSKLTPTITLIKKVQLNANIYNNAISLNQYFVGGITDFLRNQVSFIGLNEGEIFTSNITTGQLGLQIEIYKNVFTTFQSNVGLYNFLNTDKINIIDYPNSKFISGYGISIGYLTSFFPINLSFMYCDQSRNFAGSLNLGYHF